MRVHDKNLIKNLLFTWTPPTSQRSPTSNGCITNKKIIISNTDLQVFPKINPTKRSCELKKTRKWTMGTPSIILYIINRMIATRTFSKLWISSIAIFVSLRDIASPILSLNALT
jgi:hypothetical protein